MEQVIPFEWTRIWFGEDTPVSFLLEVAFRSGLMYLLTLITLRVTGKRGIKQLSMFEFSIILALGSAAGDPMFYHDVPISHAVVVFSVVIILYLFFNYLIEKSQRLEQFFEGSSALIIENGRINLKAFDKQNLTYRELFGEMRQQQVEHLGQVRKVYLETTGELSLFFYEAGKEKPGLPIFPEILAQPLLEIIAPDLYACNSCGHLQDLEPSPKVQCSECQNTAWLKACTAKRIT